MADFTGYALGGAAQGFNDSQKIGADIAFRTKELALQQQQIDNAQHRDLLNRADKETSNLLSVATQTIQSLKMRGTDNAQIAKAIQPLVQAAKRLKQSAGGDPAMIDAQIAATLAQPGFDPNSVTGGGAPATAAPAAPAPAASTAPAAPTADSGGGSPMPPGQNLTGPDTTVTGVDYGPTEYRNAQGRPVAGPAPASAQPNPNAEVDRWTKAMFNLPDFAPASIKEAVKMRLASAMQQAQPDAQVHFMKTEDGNEIPLVIRKQGQNVSITDTNGNPYVAPTGNQSSDAKAISDAIVTGKQPPVLTGLYKNAKAVRAELARSNFDLAKADLEYKAAIKQVQSINGPQMVRYQGLAQSVVNTIDEVRDLSQQMKNMGVPALNAAKIQGLIQTAGNTKEGQLATRYQAAVNTLKEEFANLANGGYAPTEPAWALANQQINGNYGVDQLSAGLTEVQRLIRYRLNAIPNFTTLGPAAGNRYVPGSGQPAAGGASTVPPPPAGFVMTSPH